jgi:20S proteasome subunit alpha 3
MHRKDDPTACGFVQPTHIELLSIHPFVAFIHAGKGRMARRYDSSTTTFSPDGRLHQVEYAIEAINNAGTAVGILAADGIVLAGEKHKPSSLLAPSKASEKMYKIDDHVVTVVAGLTADANILIQQSRVSAQRYIFTYQEPMPVYRKP